ncbi:MAG TPA: hypothetical protein VK134_03620 [Ktedonobacteraceae bacterium]|nr:hypothetical protein [Ktedonobacteraceae bacterium]
MQDRLEHGDRKGRHYDTTPPQAASLVSIVVATLAVAMLHGRDFRKTLLNRTK